MNHRPRILGIPFDVVTMASVLERAERAIRRRTFCQIVTPGPEFLMRAKEDPVFRSVLLSAEVSLPDGMGVVLAGKALGLTPPLTRVTGNDLVHGIFRRGEAEGWRIYFYGTLREGVLEQAVARALMKYPKLQIVGAESGYRRWLRIPDAAVCWRIRRARPDILFVSLGAPEQDLWIARNRSRLGTVMVAAGIGGAIDYLARAVRRAPPIVRNLGFEWFWRLLSQPKRRWRRIVTAVIEFPVAVLREKFHV